MKLSDLTKQGSTPNPDPLSWADVPGTVARWYDLSVPGLRKVASASGRFSGWFDVSRGAVSTGPGPTCVRFDKTADGIQLLPEPLQAATSQAADFAASAAKPALDTPVSSGIGSTLSSLGSLRENPVNAPFGGPTPLATSVTGSALGAGLGYLGGRIAENLLPGHLQGKRLRRTLALAGGALGAAPGLYLARLGAEADGTDYGRALVSPGVLSTEKKADAGLFGPSIRVDMFNRLVLEDPFAPPAVRAAATALVGAADQASGGGGIISVSDLARVAIGAGAGYLQAYAGAKLLGGLVGLSPPAQRALQQTGFVAGALTSAVPQLLGMR